MNDEDKSWFERNVNAIIIGLSVACVLVVLADLLYTNDHPHFEPYETFFGFQAWFGFIAFVAAVFAGRLLRMIVHRDEGYYDE